MSKKKNSKQTLLAAAALKKFRKQIDKADQRLLEAMAKRARIVQKIAKAKAKLGLPIVHTARRAQIQKDRPLQGVKLGLDRKYVDRIFRAVQAESVRCQKKIIAGLNKNRHQKKGKT